MRNSGKNKKWLYLKKILCLVLTLLIFLMNFPVSNTFAIETENIQSEEQVAESSQLPDASETEDTAEIPDEEEQTVESSQLPDASETEDTAEIPDEEEQTVEPDQISISPASTGTDYINEPLGGNTLTAGDGTRLVVMEADGDSSSGYYIAYAATAAGLRGALWDLYQADSPDTSYIMYVGADMTSLAANLFTDTPATVSDTNVNFAALSGRVDTLVLTGTQADTITDTPATSANTSIRLFSAAAGNKFFGCNIVLRNIRYNLNTATGGTGNAVFMNGYDLTLGGNSWHTAASQFFGGSNTGTAAAQGRTANTATITVYSTGTGASYFYGGMQTGILDGNTKLDIHNTSGNTIYVCGGGYGTLNGNTETNIHNTGGGTMNLYGGMYAGTLNGNAETNIYNTGGSTTIHFYGGGYGASATSTANVTGNVTNTVTGISSTGGGFDHFIGGVYYGNIDGKITNTISGPGRFAQETADYRFTYAGSFVGGSYSGNIGSDSTLGGGVNTEGLDSDYTPLAETNDYVIKNNIDTSKYTYGRMFYIGVNYLSGIVKGNIVNILKAGTNNSGSYSGVQCGGGYFARIAGTWATTANFSPSSSTGKISTPEKGVAAAKAAASFQLYGNITNVIRSGCVANSDGYYYFRGAGYGYVKGNAYTAVGTEGLVYRGSSNTYTYSTTDNNQGEYTGFDLVGGGGAESDDNSFCIIGDTTLVMYEVFARWTYGGSFGGVQVGNSKIELHKGLVDTLEGSGYDSEYHVGDSRAEVYGGQVDWFLSGGGYHDTYQDGNVSVEVFDRPNVIINASMGGTYGASATHYISGNSDIVVHGGNFSGTAGYTPYSGFSAGASLYGTIFGNATVTLDLRGNQYDFLIEAGDSISGGRRYGDISNYSVLGTNADNTITLNIFTDEENTDLLNGLNIYGDCSYLNYGSGYAGYTRSGRITININAPGAKLGNVYATSYSNLSGGTLWRDVEINLVSAGTIKGLSAGNGTENFTNTVISNSAAVNKYAVINVGPQSSDPEDILGDRETGETADGLPHRIRVTGGGTGIIGFTSMDIRERLLIAEDGSIKNGGTSVTLANHGTTYNQFGNVTLYAGDGVDASGIGVAQTGALFIAGALTVEGDGTAYVQSPGIQNQIVFTDATVNADYLTWLKVGSQSQYTNLQTNWFGASKGWFVFTLNPNGLTNAGKITPLNLRGLEADTGKVFIGDNDTHFAAYGYAVAIPASIYTWEVTEGEGMISHNVEVSISKPVSGYITAYGTVAKDTPSKQGMIAIPTENIPSPVAYPEFTFTPYVTLGEWVKGIQIHRSDEYITSPQHQNCTDISEQSISDYNVDPIVKWTTTAAHFDYSFDITAQYTSDAQLTARSVIITETEAAAITSAADIITCNQAEGRPFFANNITNSMITAIQQSLADGQYMRVHPVTYTAGDISLQGTDEQLTVNVIVVKDGTELPRDRSYGIYAGDATIFLNSAQTLSGQAELDSGYTHAIAILADGTTAAPTIDSAAIGNITSTTIAEVPKNVPVTYSYAPDASSTPVVKNVTVRVISASITIEKYGDKSGSTALPGAQFTIERWDSSVNAGAGGWVYIEYDSVTKTWSDTASGNSHYMQTTAGTGGTTTFVNLPLDRYRIQEETPPTGYATLNEPIETEVPYTIDDNDPSYSTVTGGKTPDSTVFDSGSGVTTAYYYNMTYTIIDTTVINMPTAGGGVSLVLLVLAGLGTALLAAAGYIFSRRRRVIN